MNVPNHRVKSTSLCFLHKTNVLFRTLSYVIFFMKNVIFHCLHAVGVGSWLRSQKQQHQVTVLSLHRVSDEFDPVWNPMKPNTFENLLLYVKEHYEVVRFSQLDDAPKTNKPRLVLSFDDGYKDFMEFALPLLQKYNLPCNHNFVINCVDNGSSIWTQDVNEIIGAIYQHQQSQTLHFDGVDYFFDIELPADAGTSVQLLHAMLKAPQLIRSQAIAQWQQLYTPCATRAKFMTWDDIRQCAASGLVEIGSHTVSHDSLPTITAPAVLQHELTYSKRRLEQELGQTIRVIALPNGQSNAEIRQAVAAAGYTWLLEVGDDCYNHNPIESLHIVPRINMIEESGVQMHFRVEQFHKKLKKILGRV